MFVNPDAFEQDFVDPLRGSDYRENSYRLRKFRKGWESQFELIEHLQLVNI